MKPLPYKRPSSLLAAAVADLKKARRKHPIYMHVWVKETNGVGPCSVCMAGSCLVERGMVDDTVVSRDLRLGSLPDYPSLDIDKVPQPLRGQLHAINAFRQGRIDSALSHLGKSARLHGIEPRVAVAYWVDTPRGRRNFYASMHGIVKLLRKHGL